MYKNQLQELAQRSCFNLPLYTCIREGPDHAPRFKATVNFNGESFDSPNYCTTLRQAEHSAAEVALNALASRGPSNSLASRILDETGVYKNLLQEVSQRVEASLPAYTTFRSGLGHLPVFTCIVELAGITFTGEPAKNKKQAEKNAAMAAWSSLKLFVQQSERSIKSNNEEQEHVTVAHALQKYLIKVKMDKIPFPIKFPTNNPRPSNPQPPAAATSKILPLIFTKNASQGTPFSGTIANHARCPRTAAQSIPTTASSRDTTIFLKSALQSQPIITGLCDNPSQSVQSPRIQPQRFPVAGAAPYIPATHSRPHHTAAPPVTIRNAIPVYSAPPIPPPSQASLMRRPPQLGAALPVFAAPPARVEESSVPDMLEKPREQPMQLVVSRTLIEVEEPLVSEAPSVHIPPVHMKGPPVTESPTAPAASSLELAECTKSAAQENLQESVVVNNLEELKL